MAGASSMEDPRALVTVALAIAVHNIPEGICTSAPYYLATGRRLRAFLWSSSTALPVLWGFWAVMLNIFMENSLAINNNTHKGGIAFSCYAAFFIFLF